MTDNERIARSVHTEAIPVIHIGATQTADRFAIWSGPEKQYGGRFLCAWVSSIPSAWEQVFLRIQAGYR